MQACETLSVGFFVAPAQLRFGDSARENCVCSRPGLYQTISLKRFTQ